MEAGVFTFLIADVRGYTRFTQEHGDEAAARLAGAFAEIAHEGVAAHGGNVVEIRGDEALAVFPSARQALRAAVVLQQTFADEVALHPSLPLRVGMGVDAGEAVPVGAGYRGGALNLAARLCSNAGPGEVLASQGVVHLARVVDGLRYADRGSLELKGIDDPVTVHAVDSVEPPAPLAPPDVPVRELPPQLVALTPLIGRDREARTLRWLWRRSRRSLGVATVVGAAGIGKTRLAAAVAETAARDGFPTLYGSCLGASAGVAAVIAEASATPGPALLVLDDLEASDAADAQALGQLVAERTEPILVLCAFRDDEAPADLVRTLAAIDPAPQLVKLGALDEESVRQIASLYVGGNDPSLPLSDIVRESGGVPARIHQVASEWAHSRAARRLGETAARTSSKRHDLLATEAELTTTVLDLRQVQERTQLYAEPARGARVAQCPYKGLASFELEDAPFFFGRERLVAELVARLAGTSFLAVAGPSGSGKSSAVKAGLVPALAAGVLPGSEAWPLCLFRPGAQPLRELDRAVFAALSSEERAALPSHEDTLEAASAIVPEPRRLLVVVDQFEEIFTVCSDHDVRAAFVAALVRAVRGERASVVIALRADFYGRCAEHAELAELVAASNVLVGPMNADEYRRAIEEPAKRAGLRIEPALVESLVAEVVDEPGGLPLLSTALVEQWQARDGRVLRFEAYRESGGVRGAVARLADASYESLTPSQQDVARALLLRLSAGEGETAVRRRVPLAELDAAENEDVAAVLNVFVRDRLLVVSEGTVEVAHEALLREWPRLAAWLEEDREGRRLREHLIQQAREWEAHGRDTGELYRGARLNAALDWTTEHTLELNERERAFLQESQAASESEATRQRRQNRRLRTALVAVAIVLVLAVIAGALALVARSHAQSSATAAVAQRLGAQALVAKDLDLSLLLARQGVALDDSTATRGNLEAALVRSPAALRIARPLPGRLLGVSTSPNGRLLIVLNNLGQKAIVDARTLKTLRTYPHLLANQQHAFTNTNQVSSFEQGKHAAIAVADPLTGAEHLVASVSPDAQGFALAPELDYYAIATGTPNRTVLSAYDVRTHTLVHRLVETGLPVVDVEILRHRLLVFRAPSPNDPWSKIEIWSSRPWRQIAVVARDGMNAWDLDNTGERLALGYVDGSVSVTDLRTGSTRTFDGRHDAAVQGVAFSPDGKTLASAGDDKQVIVWDVASGRLREIFQGHAGRVFAPAFSPDGRTLYTDSLDGALIAWDVSGVRRLETPFRAGSGGTDPKLPFTFERLAVSPDDTKVAAVEADGRTAVDDLATGKRLFETAKSPGGAVLAVAWSPNDRTFATAGLGGAVDLWNGRNGSFVRSYGGLKGKPCSSIAVSPDGGVLAAGCDDFSVHLWNVASGRADGPPLKLRNYVPHVAFSHDAHELVATEQDVPGPQGGVADVWRLADRKLLYRVDIDNGFGLGFAADFSPDGKLLATGGGNGMVKFWDARTGKPAGRSFIGNPGWVRSVEFDRAGRLLLTAGTDGLLRLWDVKTRSEYGAPLPASEGLENEAAFTPDGTHVVAVDQNGGGIDWDIRPSSWEARACSVAGRRLTRDEWAQYLPGRAYHPACT